MSWGFLGKTRPMTRQRQPLFLRWTLPFLKWRCRTTATVVSERVSQRTNATCCIWTSCKGVMANVFIVCRISQGFLCFAANYIITEILHICCYYYGNGISLPGLIILSSFAAFQVLKLKVLNPRNPFGPEKPELWLSYIIDTSATFFPT